MDSKKASKGSWYSGMDRGTITKRGNKDNCVRRCNYTGGSAIKAATRLRDAGYIVNRVVSIVDRQQDNEANEFMESSELELVSIFKLDDLI